MTEKSRNKKAVLSKSTFIKGLQCIKALYLYKNRYFLRDPLSPEQRAKFSRGTDVGIYAQGLFPGGVDASPPTHFQMAKSVEKTAGLLQDPSVDVIYEAAFEFDEVIVALDILYRENGAWKGIEVKSSRSVSETYRWDASLQYYVITGSGLQLADFSIAFINENYAKEGPIDPSRLFLMESLLELAKERRNDVAVKVEELKAVTKLKSSPEIPIGTHCHDPYTCEFVGHCWKKVPQDAVFRLDGVDEHQKFRWYHNGIVSVGEIPADITEQYQLAPQIESISKGSPVVDKHALAEYLKEVERQACLTVFDLAPAIPVIEGTRPYQKIPWGFCISSQNGNPIMSHMEDPATYSPGNLIARLSQLTDEYEVIWTFDPERLLTLLEHFGDLFPEMTHLKDKLQPHLKDLLLPLKEKLIVWPGMTTSMSQENILRHFGKTPTALPEKMVINEEAAAVYERLLQQQVVSKENNEREILEKFMLAKHANSILLLNLWKQLSV